MPQTEKQKQERQLKVVALIKASNAEDAINSYNLAKTCDFDDVVLYLNKKESKLAKKLAACKEKPPLLFAELYGLEGSKLPFGEFTKFNYLKEIADEYSKTREDHLRITTFCDFPENTKPKVKTKDINKIIKHWREQRVASVRSEHPEWCDALLGASKCTAPNYRVKHRIVAVDDSGGFGHRYKMIYMTKHPIPSESNKGIPIYFSYSGIGFYSHRAISKISSLHFVETSNNALVEDCGILDFLETDIAVNVKPYLDFQVAEYDYSEEVYLRKSLLDRVARAWEKYPSLRFVQLVLNAALYHTGVSCPEAYYLKDDKLRQKIEECLPK